MLRMLRVIAAALLALASAPLAAQDAKPADPPHFELADVHTSRHSNDAFISGGALMGNRYIIHQATMVDLISKAYGVSNENVLSGPSWLDYDRFDIIARAPRNTSPENLQLMLRALLAQRFHLILHNDVHPIPSYVLRVDKGGLRIKEADASEPRNLEQHHTPTNLPPGTPAYYSITCKNITMDNLRAILHDFATQYLPKPVIDATGLKSGYDFDLHWTWKPAPDGLTIFEAVKKQLGLSLELENYPTPVLIVESVDEHPTPNAPGLDKALPPPPPAEFEVAVLKPSAPDTRDIRGRINGGNINLTGGTVQWMITWAYDISNDMIANPPKWLSQDKWDLVAKAPAANLMQTDPRNGPPIDLDDLRQMVKTLLADRFQLQVHTEDRPYDAYTLVAADPKLKKADPLNRTNCHEGPGADGKDPRIANPILGRLITCQNMTMAQFGQQLQTLANGYIHTPVLDQTGLKGAYDFTISFSTVGQLRTGNPEPGGDPPNTSPPTSSQAGAADPSGAISLPEAIQKQLGVKLEKQKRPVPMLVIDHIQEKPTDN